MVLCTLRAGRADMEPRWTNGISADVHKFTGAAIAGAVAVMLLSEGVRMILPAAAIERQHQEALRNVINIQYGQSNGDCNQNGLNYGSINNICHNTYNMAPADPHINDALEDQIPAKIPKDKPVTVTCS